MSNSTTLVRPSAIVLSNGFGFKPNMYRKDNGKLALERVAVFRSGTFRDSMGIQNTWESLHIKQMIDNYEHLRDNGIFDDVPVRDGHPGWLIHGLPGNGKVVGWHTNLFTENVEAPHDGQKYDYLFADFEITDDDAKVAIENGTWRNRSAEVGTYLTNNEAEFWPVYMGFAYVDIPAVEGLKFNSPNSPKLYVMMDKEISVGDNNNPTSAPAAPAQPAVNPQVALAGQGAIPLYVFTVRGQATSDFNSVQAHINALEAFQRETAEQNRKDFIAGLARDNKILGTAENIAAMEAFAIGLSPEQFDQYRNTWQAAQAAPVLGQHGQSVTNPNNSAESGQSAQDKQYETWRSIVKQHKLSGASVEAIKKTDSYKNLVAANQPTGL